MCLGMVEPVGCVVGHRARVCLGMCACLGVAEPGWEVCSRVSGARVLGYGGACGVCSWASGARVVLGYGGALGRVVGCRARVCLGMVRRACGVCSRVSGAPVLGYG